MPESKRFRKNVDLWTEKNPKAALLLPYVDCKGWEFCKTLEGEINLRHNGDYYHTQTGALQEARTWFSQLDLTEIQILYVYGVGLGYYYTAAKEWLEENPAHHIVFLEDELPVIHRLFETDAGSHLLKDPQAHLYSFQELKESTQIFENLFWNFVLTNMRISALNYYAMHKAERYNDLLHKLIYDASIKNSLLDEYLKYGMGFYKNFYPNMLYLPGSYYGNHLFGKFHKVPAIICGAGPSLAKQIPLLGKLMDKAIIFAGGSALNALNSVHLQPHFGVGIDPNIAQYERMSKNQAYEVPFFYRNRMFHKAFQAINGPRLYVTGSSGYYISDWFDERFGIKSQLFDEGHNVVNFCLQIAREMGCDPIIFVGLDLAYTGDLQYAPGVVANAALDKKNALHTQDFDNEALVKPDIYGQPVYTLWKWVAEAEWISTFARDHPEATLINATEGGIGIPQVTNQSFQEAADLYLNRSFALPQRIHGEIQNSPLSQVSYERIAELMEEFKASLDRCVEYLNALLEESDVVKKRLKKAKKSEAIPLQTGRAALCETELSEEPGYQYVLDVLNLTISLVLNRELNNLVLSHKRISAAKKNIKKLDINDKKLTFLRDAAYFNSKVISLALEGEILDQDGLCKPTNIHLKTR